MAFLSGGFIGEWLHGKMFLVVLVLFGIVGIALAIVIWRKKIDKWLKRFLLLTGLSTAGFFIFGVLHNLFYALEILSEGIFLLPQVLGVLHVGFFLIAMIACPISLVVGMVGGVVQFCRKCCGR